MSEQKPTRLAKAATYFNVGREEIVGFLRERGFEIDYNPNAKIDDLMFEELNDKFKSDYSIKVLSNAIRRGITISEFKFLVDFYKFQIKELTDKKSVIDTPNSYIIKDNQIIALNIEKYINKELLSSIGTLKYLEVLSIRDCNIENLEFLEKLVKLTVLDLKSNKIKNIEVISNLFNLETLVLTDNIVSNIIPVCNLKNLIFIDISFNKIQSIEFLLECEALVELIFINNPVYSKIPFNIIQTKDIKQILKYKRPDILKLEMELGYTIEQNNYEVENNQIVSFFFSNTLISKWTSDTKFHFVKYINVSNTYIDSYDFIHKCFPNLEAIDAENNSLIDPFEFLKLTNLNCLNLSNNKIEKIQFTSNLNNLKKLFLSDNKINSIENIEKIKNIECINLSNNEIKNLVGFEKLLSLKELYLEKNNLVSIKPILELEKLETVFLNKNDDIEELKVVTAEEIQLGWSSILKSINADERIEFKEVKILLLGNPNIGKSDLLEFLEKGEKPTIKESTHGIKYEKITLGDDINCHVWDFGGQEYYHATHQLFFSPNALNIVLWGVDIARDASSPDKCFRLDYWLRSIQYLNDNDGISNNISECIIVENKIDLKSFIPTHLNSLELNEKFDKLNLYFQNISLSELKRVNGLKELIIDILSKIITTNKRPKYYKTYIDNVNSSDKNFILINDVAHSKSLEDNKKAMSLLHNMGMILYFKDIIPDKVFNQPQELLDLLYHSILSDSKKYRISKEHIEHAINGNTLGVSVNQIIQLLTQFNLIFKIQWIDDYFIPQYLPSKPNWLEIIENYKFSLINVKITSDTYLINLVLLKLFTEYGKDVKRDSKDYMFWNEGLLIEKDNQILLIKVNKTEQCIELHTDPTISNFELQKEVINFIKNCALKDQDFPKSTVYIHEQMDGKIDWVSDYFKFLVSYDGENFIEWELLNKTKANRIEINGELHSQRYFKKYINDESRMKTIAISYSKDDFKIVNSFVNSLKSLVIEGTIDDPWWCSELSPGDEVDNKIIQKFKDADILCFMCSNNFFKTNYIIENELKPAIARYNSEKKQLILPIIIDRCKWTLDNPLVNLGQFAAFPYRTKPVSDFNNINDAWYVTNWFLEHIIKGNKNNDYDSATWNCWGVEIKSLPNDITMLLEKQINGDLDKK